MLVSCDQNAGLNQDIKIGNRSFENMPQFTYLGTPKTDTYFLLRRELRAD
jgi:hypothetical protein